MGRGEVALETVLMRMSKMTMVMMTATRMELEGRRKVKARVDSERMKWRILRTRSCVARPKPFDRKWLSYRRETSGFF